MSNKISSATIGRLKYSKGIELNDAIAKCISLDISEDSEKQIVEIVRDRIVEGEYILDNNITALLRRTSDTELYEATKERLFRNTWSLIDLFGLEIDDEEIEHCLSEKLSDCARNDTEPFRRYIVEALGKYSSSGVLPLLEMLFEDLEPSATVRSLFSHHLDAVGMFEAKSRISFVQLLAEAIENIKERSESGDILVRSDQADERVESENRPPYLEYLLQAKDLLSKNPEASMGFIRKGTESIAKEICIIFGLDVAKVKKLTLGPLVKEIKQFDEVEEIHRLLETIVPLGNYSSHDQGGRQSDVISEELTNYLLNILKIAARRFEVWQKSRIEID